MAVDDSTLAPTWDIEVDGTPIGEGIKDLVHHVEYESCDGLADVGRVKLSNPKSIVSNAKAFQPGKELSIYAGYGSGNLKHIGTVEILKNRPNYPQGTQPTFEVVGYTKDAKMMDDAPKKSKNKKKKSSNRIYPNSKVSDAVETVSRRYGFDIDIDITPDVPHNIPQKVGMTDYEFVKGLSNITGFVFWVDGDGKGNWTLHFRNPELLKDQEKTYTFTYDEGGAGGLLSFTPEQLIKGAYTKLTVVVKDIRTGKLKEVEVEEDNQETVETAGAPFEEVQGELTTASDIKIYFDSYSFREVSDKIFKTEKEIEDWAKQWFRRQRENFVLARGRAIGIETIMSREVHNINGTSPLYNGKYYFSKVKHLITKTTGYVLDIGARKIVR
jgi:phage protein D